NTISDETVRRYYRQDFSARLRQMFAPQNFSRNDIAGRRQNFGANRFADNRGGAPGRRPSPKAAFGDETYVAASAQLAAGPLPPRHPPPDPPPGAPKPRNAPK